MLHTRVRARECKIRKREREREREGVERHTRTLFRFLQRLQQRRSAGGPCGTGKIPLEETEFERECDQLRALQKDPCNIEFARSVQKTRRNKSTRMSSSSEHNIIDSLFAFEAKAAQKNTPRSLSHVNDRRSAHFEEQRGAYMPRRNIPRLRARAPRCAAQRKNCLQEQNGRLMANA